MLGRPGYIDIPTTKLTKQKNTKFTCRHSFPVSLAWRLSSQEETSVAERIRPSWANVYSLNTSQLESSPTTQTTSSRCIFLKAVIDCCSNFRESYGTLETWFAKTPAASRQRLISASPTSWLNNYFALSALSKFWDELSSQAVSLHISVFQRHCVLPLLCYNEINT